MTQHILVAYDTKNGSTAEVAQAIAESLRSHGALVDVALASGVRDLSGIASALRTHNGIERNAKR